MTVAVDTLNGMMSKQTEFQPTASMRTKTAEKYQQAQQLVTSWGKNTNQNRS